MFINTFMNTWAGNNVFRSSDTLNKIQTCPYSHTHTHINI